MKKLIVSTTLLLLWYYSSAQSGNFYFVVQSPAINSIQDSVLEITLSVTSSYQIKGIVAKVMDRQIDLVYNGSYYVGNLQLAGLKQDTLTLELTATDALNNQKTQTVRFVYDNPPVVIVESPLDYTVARPEIVIKAKCRDDLPGCILQVAGGRQERDSITTTLDLSNNESSRVYVDVKAIDVRKQATIKRLSIYVENSPYLSEYFSAQDRIWDFNYGKLLTMHDSAAPNNSKQQLKVVDIASNTQTTIPYTGKINFLEGSPSGQLFGALTPGGAIFLADSLPYAYNPFFQVMEWNGNKLTQLTPGYDQQNNRTGAASLAVAGGKAIWFYTESTQLPITLQWVIRDLTAGISTPLKYPDFTIQDVMDIKPDGTNVQTGKVSGSNVINAFLVKNNTRTQVSNVPGNHFVSNARTDGSRVAYTESFLSNADSNWLKLYDGGTPKLLSATASGQGGIYYQMNKDFVAYSILGNGSVRQLWLLNKAGISKQITLFGATSDLEKLGADGDMMFLTTISQRRKRFWADSTGAFKQITSGDFGTPYQIGSDWFMAIGRTLFRLNLNYLPSKVADFNITAANDSTYGFDKADFTSHFSGAGQLLKLRIETLPLHGKLKLVTGGQSADLTAGYVLDRAQMPASVVTYVPDPEYNGVDSLRWSAYNGVDFTAPALITIRVKGTLPLPVVMGIKAVYCAAEGQQKGKMANLPAAPGITFTATLDSAVLPVGADSLISFNVGTLAPGQHTLRIMYADSLTSKQSSYSFSVAAAVSPDVNLVASDATVPAAFSGVVTVTAKNAAGGGTAPLFLFAKDRNFSNVLRTESQDSVLSLASGQLSTGDNWFYVRMKTSASCYQQQLNVDSIRIVRQPAVQPPAIPAVAGVKSNYCSNEGVQKVRISNLPDTSVQVSVLLDATRLTIAADTTVSFNPADFPAGAHSIVLQYTNAAGSNSTKILITFLPAVTPDVDASSSITLVTDLSVPVVVTATAKAGGGSTPLFLFASDKAFTKILQAEGSAATCTISGANLAVGDNWIYVHMKTSETCFSSQTSVDSVLVRRDQATGITDPDNPSSVITVFPNPFRNFIRVSGLSVGKSYTLLLYSLQGIRLREQQVRNTGTATMYNVPATGGVYWLVIQDDSRKRQLGRIQLMNR